MITGNYNENKVILAAPKSRLTCASVLTFLCKFKRSNKVTYRNSPSRSKIVKKVLKRCNNLDCGQLEPEKKKRKKILQKNCVQQEYF